jgi:sorbitol-specific phosphotransferase system component IIBC
MKARSSEKRNVTTAKAIAILKQNGREVSEKEAEKILELMYFLAKLIVNQNVNI